MTEVNQSPALMGAQLAALRSEMNAALARIDEQIGALDRGVVDAGVTAARALADVRAIEAGFAVIGQAAGLPPPMTLGQPGRSEPARPAGCTRRPRGERVARSGLSLVPGGAA
jgi:hypothetical protein